MKNNKKILG